MTMTAAARRRLDYLMNLHDHPKTSPGEKEAARAAMARINAKFPEQVAATPGWNPNMFIGARYQQGQDVKDIARIIRNEIKAARKHAKNSRSLDQDGAVSIIDPIGDLPDEVKISVRIDRYSGGQSIDIALSGIDKVEGPWFEDRKDPLDFGYGSMLVPTPKLKAVINALYDMLNAFNYDGSDIQTDYFNVNFYTDVSVGGISYGYLR